MSALLSFFSAVIIAYLSVCAAWVIVTRLRPKLWPTAPGLKSDRPWLDLALAAVAVIAILALGQSYRAGYLLHSGAPALGPLAYTLNQLIIFAPIVIVLAIRGQGPATVFLSPAALPMKLITGLLLGIAAVAIYLGASGRLGDLPAVLLESVRPQSLERFLPVFLEGVALAFVFVRVRWTFGTAAALLIPSVLFAISHIPRQLESHLPIEHIALYFALNTLLPVAILYVVSLSADVIWLGIVHYLMDVAIHAFD
jgi:hypothetical protein